MSEDAFPVVIIGGGLAGLTAGLHLASRGIAPMILEADSLWAGGRLAGGAEDVFEYQGRRWAFSTEHGMHALWGGYDNLRATFERFLDLRLQPSPGEEWINRWRREVRYIEAGNAVRSRWLPAPFHYLQLLFHPMIWANITPLDFLSLPGLLASIFLTLGFDPIAEQRPLDGLGLREYFRGWTPNLRATFTGLAVNLLAAPEEDISLAGFIAALRFYTMLRRDSWQMSYLPADSYSAVILPMIEKIEDAGGMLLRGAEVTHLEAENGAWRIFVEDSQRGGKRSLLAEKVILAVDPLAASRILQKGQSTAEAAASIRFPGTVNSLAVRLWFSVSPREGTPGGMFTGDFAPDNFFWLHRLYGASFHDWHESTGGGVIEMHFYPNRDLAAQSDSHFLILGLDEAQRAFPELRGQFVHGAVRRNLKTHPVFRIPRLADSLFVETPWPGVLACGDWIGAETPSLWMERSVVTAILAANRILEAAGQPPYPLIVPKQPEVTARVLGTILHLLRKVFGPPLAWAYRLLRGGKKAHQIPINLV